jgi:hypothetical protein
MTPPKLEKVLENIILTQLVPSIDINSPSDKLSIKSVIVKNNIYRTLIKMIGYLYNSELFEEKAHICEISFSDQSLIVRNPEESPKDFKETNDLFINKSINIIVSGDKFFRAPRFYLYFHPDKNLLRVSPSNARIAYFDPNTGTTYFDKEKQEIIDNCFKFIYEEIFSKAVSQNFDLLPNHRKDMKICMFLFFIQNDSRNVWYCTLMADYWRVCVDNGSNLYAFIKPIELSNNIGSEIKELNRLLLLAMGGIQT